MLERITVYLAAEREGTGSDPSLRWYCPRFVHGDWAQKTEKGSGQKCNAAKPWGTLGCENVPLSRSGDV